MKSLTNIADKSTELTWTYLACKSFLLGGNVIFNPSTSNFSKYDLGLAFSPTDNAVLAVKHESTNKDQLALGKFLFLFYHNASAANTLGSEFTLDWQKKVIEARAGVTHKFSEDVLAKVKVNQDGNLDAAIKYKLSESTSTIVTSGLSLKDAQNQKAKPLPIGLSFEFKF